MKTMDGFHMILREHENKDGIFRKQLVSMVADITGLTTASVNGTMTNTLEKQVWFKGIWGMVNSTKKFMLRKFASPDELEDMEINYDTPSKRKSRCVPIDILKRLGIADPHVVTMGAIQGHCVIAFNEAFPNSHIINVEHDKEVMERFLINCSIQTENFHGKMKDFVEKHDLYLDLMFIDYTGYYSEKDEYILELINQKMPTVVVLNYQHYKEFRNNPESKWIIKKNKKYKNYKDKIRKSMCDNLSKYKLVKKHRYKLNKKSREMCLYAFVLKSEIETLKKDKNI